MAACVWSTKHGRVTAYLSRPEGPDIRCYLDEGDVKDDRMVNDVVPITQSAGGRG